MRKTDGGGLLADMGSFFRKMLWPSEPTHSPVSRSAPARTPGSPHVSSFESSRALFSPRTGPLTDVASFVRALATRDKDLFLARRTNTPNFEHRASFFRCSAETQQRFQSFLQQIPEFRSFYQETVPALMSKNAFLMVYCSFVEGFQNLSSPMLNQSAPAVSAQGAADGGHIKATFAEILAITAHYRHSCAYNHRQTRDSEPDLSRSSGEFGATLDVRPLETSSVSMYEGENGQGSTIGALIYTYNPPSEGVMNDIINGHYDTTRAKIWKTYTGCSMVHNIDPSFYMKRIYHVLGENMTEYVAEYPRFGSDFDPADHPCLGDPIILDIMRSITYMLFYEYGNDFYMPFIPDLVSLFLNHLNASEAYVASVLCIVQSLTIEKYFSLSRKSVAADLELFERLCAFHCQPVFEKMFDLNVDVSDFACRWFDRLFVGTLPYDTVLRFFDCFVGKGRCVMMRTGLAILQLAEDALLRTYTAEQFLDTLDAFAKKLVDKTALMKVALSIPMEDSLVVFTNFRPYRPNNANATEEAETEDVEEDPSLRMVCSPYTSLQFENPSAILNRSRFEILLQWIPYEYQIDAPRLIFTSSMDGHNLSHMMYKCANHSPLIMIIQSTDKNIFGCFVPTGLKVSNDHFFGTGEAFLFTLSPEARVYMWEPGRNQNFFMVNKRASLSIGSGLDGPGLYFNEMLENCRTYRCETFRNEPLNNGRTEFVLSQIEIFALQFM